MSSSADYPQGRASTVCALGVVTLRVLAAACSSVADTVPADMQGVLSLLTPIVSLGGAYIVLRYFSETAPLSAFSAPEKEKVSTARLLLLFLGAACGGMLLAVMLTRVFGLHTAGEIPTGTALLWYGAANCLLAPALEELLFRGAMLGLLRGHGDSFAVLAASVLFALGHTDALRWPAALLCGAALGVCAVETGSLRLPVLLHILYNIFQLVLLSCGITPPLLILAAGLVTGAVQVTFCVPGDGDEPTGAMLRRFFLTPAVLLLCVYAVAAQVL